MNMPATLPVDALLPTNPTFYDAGMINIVEDLYDSRRMAKKKLEYLRPRSGDKASKSYLEGRLNSAQYLNHFGAKLQDTLSEILCSPPLIMTKTKDAFWDALNSNCNGYGQDLRMVLMCAGLELLKHGRGYFRITNKYNICSVDAEDVDDAEFAGDDGPLTMARVHTIAYERKEPYLPIDTEVHRWTYYRADGIFEYTAKRSLPMAQFNQWLKKDTATLKEYPNPLPGRCPIFAACVPSNYSLGHQLAAPAIALWNRESAREYAIDVGALNQPVLKTDKPDVKDVFMNEMNIISPGEKGDFGWVAPPLQVFTALKESADDQRQQFDRTAAASHQNQTQNARQSSTAKQMDEAPKRNMLATYSETLRDGFQAAMSAICDKRDDAALDPRLTGLFTLAPDAGEMVADTDAFLSLPDMPQGARVVALERVISAFLPNLSSDQQKTIADQLKELADKEPTPPPVQPFNALPIAEGDEGQGA